MKKNKILLVLIVLIGIFVFNQNVYADECGSFNHKNITIKAYIADEDNYFKEYEMIRAVVATGNGILAPYDTYGDYAYKITVPRDGDQTDTGYTSQKFEIIDGKYLITIPSKEGYYFNGWYLDEELTKKFEDSALNTSSSILDLNLTLYGKWTKENINSDKKIYEFGKDAYVIRFMKNSYFSCEIYSEYVYVPETGYMSNTKGQITELPKLSGLNGKTFDGWYYQTEKVNSLSDLNEIIKKDNYNVVRLLPKFVSEKEEPTSTPEPTTKEDDPDTTGPTETVSTVTEVKTEEKSNNNLYLYIGLASAGVALVLLVSALVTSKGLKKNNK